jgi:prevent-host-death family protein
VKVIGLREAKDALSDYVDRAQKERVLITRHGKPAALVIGVEGQDLETIMLGSDPDFWAMIAERRKSPAMLSSEEVLARVEANAKKKGGAKKVSAKRRESRTRA